MQKFDFWMPIGATLEKGGTGTVSSTGGMFLEGIASTKDKDADGESLDPEGFDLEYFMKGGIVNWHHQAAKDPDAIIGVPISATITKAGLHIKVQLYDGDPLAEKVFRKAQQMEKSGLGRSMGFSIEGQATERDPNNESFVTKAMITGVAITHMPKNANTFANICKSLSTDDGSALIKESVDKDLKVTDYESNEEKAENAVTMEPKKSTKRRGLTKAVALEVIFSSLGDITVSSAENVFRLAQHIAASDMKDNNKDFLTADVTDQDISKAVEALQLQKAGAAPCDDEDEEEEEDEEKEDGKKGKMMSKAVNNDFASNNKAFNVLVKGIANLGGRQRERDANMGILFKGMYDMLGKVSARSEELATEVLDLTKALGEVTEKLDQPVARKGQVASTRDRNFDKGLEGGELEAKPTTQNSANTVDINTQRGKNIVKGMLGELTFAKGFDQDYAQAALGFDANGTLPNTIVARLKADKGVDVVANAR